MPLPPDPPRLASANTASPEPAGRGAVVAWLDGRINYERSSTAGHWGLGRMRRLLELLGDPQRGLPVVHVAGTKGKGSTVAMLAAMLDSSGYRVGRYMSPHVHRLEERIAVGREEMTSAALMDVWQPIRQAVEQMDQELAPQGRRGPTWFEILTAMALLHFRRQKVDIAVLETGLGGRLDATNVCEPLLAVITSISLDHMRELGDTVAQVAGEKAGIIKPGVPVLCGARDPAAREVISAVAARQRSPLLLLDRDFSLDVSMLADGSDPWPRQLVSLTVCDHVRSTFAREPVLLEPCEVGMLGRHQAENAGLAMAAAALLHEGGYPILWNGVRGAMATLQLPARIERLGEQPRLIVDAAHNAASMAALCETLPRLRGGGKRVLVFAASADKQLPEMLHSARGWAERLVLTRYTTSARAASLDVLRGAVALAAPELLSDCVAEPDPLHATRTACEIAGSDGTVCIAGSFFLAAEVRSLLLAEPGADEA